jgi:NADH-quinone oxidoreductase subunit N
MTVSVLCLLLPEIALIVAAVTIYMAGAFLAGKDTEGNAAGHIRLNGPAPWLWRWIAGGALLLAAILLCSQSTAWFKRIAAPSAAASRISADAAAGLPGSAGDFVRQTNRAAEPLYFDDLARFTRWLAIGLGGLLLLLSSRPDSSGTSERIGSLLLTVAGLMLVAVAGDLVLLFVALELISIPTYVLLYLGRQDEATQEATTKYFFLSVLASAILLYGFSFLYGVAGSTGLAAIRAALDGTHPLPPGFSAFAKLAMAMIFGGLCFRITAAPFQFYAPDVYQGTTHSNAALLSVVPKAAGFVVMLRLLVVAMPGMAPHSWLVVLATAALTMTFGNVMALWQDNLRRLLAYSSIAQAGYMLVALAVALAVGPGAGAWDGVSAIAFYLTTYAVATIGAFAVLEHLGRPDRSLDGQDELAGLGATRPAAAAMLAVCMFSLAGIPPLAGFWGKLLVFGGALSVDTLPGVAGFRWCFVAAAILGVLNSAVAAAYYLRIIAVMYFRTPLATPRAEGGAGPWWAAAVCALLLLTVGVYPAILLRETDEIGDRLSATESTPQAGEGRFESSGPIAPIEKESRHSSLPRGPERRLQQRVTGPTTYPPSITLLLSEKGVTTQCHSPVK